MKLGWVYFSESENKKSLDMLSRLLIPGAMDELGLGLVRDAFSNEFFPGTSTIQTRAKYFIILNNILDDFSSVNIENKSIQQLLENFRKEEYLCAKRLNSIYKNKDGEPVNGIIGGDNEYVASFDSWIKRTPSQIYWSGLKTYEIVSSEIISVRNYLSKSLNEKSKTKANEQGKKRNGKEEDSYNYDAATNDIKQFNVGCNTEETYLKSKNWIEELTIDLSKEESSFLNTRIQTSILSSGKLISWLLKKNINIKTIMEGYDEQNEKECKHRFEYFINQLKQRYKDIPQDYLDLFETACNYNRLSTIARIRYNIILSDYKNKEWEELFNRYITETGSIDKELIAKIYIRFKNLNPRDKEFLSNILKEYNNNISGQLDNFRKFDEYLIKQEQDIKGKKKARLLNKDKKLDNKGRQVWIGGYELDFRLSNVAIILDDIFNGLNNA